MIEIFYLRQLKWIYIDCYHFSNALMNFFFCFFTVKSPCFCDFQLGTIYWTRCHSSCQVYLIHRHFVLSLCLKLNWLFQGLIVNVWAFFAPRDVIMFHCTFIFFTNRKIPSKWITFPLRPISCVFKLRNLLKCFNIFTCLLNMPKKGNNNFCIIQC